MFVLDTDAITHDQNAHHILSAKVSNTPRTQLFVTSVTVAEQLRGRLAYINRYRKNSRQSAQGHAGLAQTVSYFNRWNILLLDEEAHSVFRQLQKQRLRIGTQDLRIAAITLLRGFTVVTSNVRDFAQVPNLKVEDWTTAFT